MSLRTSLAQHRRTRPHRRDERAFERLLARAPTVESAHELRSLSTRR